MGLTKMLNKNNFKLSTIHKIAYALNTPLSYFMEGDTKQMIQVLEKSQDNYDKNFNAAVDIINEQRKFIKSYEQQIKGLIKHNMELLALVKKQQNYISKLEKNNKSIKK